MASWVTTGTSALATLAVALVACANTTNPKGDTPSSPCSDFYDATIAYEKACAPGTTVFPLPRDRSIASCELVVHAADVGDASGDVAKCAQDRRDAIDGCKPLRDCSYSPGQRANGIPCGTDAQCGSTFCKGSGVSTQDEVCGVCSPRLSDGDACDPKVGGCAYTSACVTDPAMKTSTCKPIVVTPVGGACNTTDRLCDSNGTCDVGNTKTCVARGDVGAKCKIEGDCKIGVSCYAGNCVAPKQEGEPCTLDDQTHTTDCLEGLLCSMQDHLCHPPVLGMSGATCDDIGTICETGCQFPTTGGTGTCQTVIADGQPCDPTKSDQSCDLYAFCIKGTCKYYDPNMCVIQ